MRNCVPLVISGVCLGVEITCLHDISSAVWDPFVFEKGDHPSVSTSIAVVQFPPGPDAPSFEYSSTKMTPVTYIHITQLFYTGQSKHVVTIVLFFFLTFVTNKLSWKNNLAT